MYIFKEEQTSVFTTLPNGRFVVGCKCVFKVKLKFNECIDHYKTHFIAKGYFQVVGIDYFETFSHVIKISSIRFLMAIVVCRKGFGITSNGCKDYCFEWIFICNH